MRKEAGLGDVICEALGLSGGGVAGAGACELVVKGIEGIIGKGKGAVQEGLQGGQKNDDLNIMISYQQLADTLRALGCQYPTYTDPEQLRQFFLQAGKINPQDQLKFVNSIRSFVTAGSVIKAQHPTFVNEAVKYAFDYYKRHGYDLASTIKNLSELTEKAADPKYSFYIISMITGNYQSAFLFSMLLNYGKVDEQTYRSFSNISNIAIEMLGQQSTEVLNINTLMDQKALVNADMFSKRLDTHKFLIPYEKEALKIEQSIIDSCYPIVKDLLKNPAIAKFLPYLIMLPQLKDAGSYIIGGAGQAIQGGLK